MKVVFSGIQPTGSVTIANYLGAIKNWLYLQENYNCFFSIVDLHAITVRQDPKELNKRILEFFALLLALGIDCNKSCLFIQSQNPNHAELQWILNCFTYFGELSRMTQFKDKSKKHTSNINVGLFNYPVLMAADILLYNTNLVPVGEDQKQHLELCRDIAIRFNNIYGNIFNIPEPLIPKVTARIMSLQDPSKKMEKSNPDPNTYISILDSNDAISKKIKKAVTDSLAKFNYDFKNQPGLSNLINIYLGLTDKSLDEIAKEFENRNYSYFKNQLIEVIINILTPIREKYNLLINDLNEIKNIASQNLNKAISISSLTLKKVKEVIGFLL